LYNFLCVFYPYPGKAQHSTGAHPKFFGGRNKAPHMESATKKKESQMRYLLNRNAFEPAFSFLYCHRLHLLPNFPLIERH